MPQMSASDTQLVRTVNTAPAPTQDAPSLSTADFATVAVTTKTSETSHHIPEETSIIQTTPVPMAANTHSTSVDPTPLPSQATAASAVLTSSAPPMLDPAEAGLPDWPPMLTIFLLSWTVMGWLVAVLLYLATFPERVRWLDRQLAGWREKRDANSDTNPSGSNFHHQRNNTQARNTKWNRKPTADIGTGLGIAMTDVTVPPRFRKRRSFDQGVSELRKRRPYGDMALTAPLPSKRSFAEVSPTSSADEDSAEPAPRVTDHERAKEKVETRGVWDREPSLRSKDAGISGVLKSVGAVLEFVAARLAGMTSDRVGGSAEEGLLLPMKSDERGSPAGVMSDY